MNLSPKFSPDVENKGSNLEKERKPLAIYPIFRGNDLYCAIFPEIKPLFEKGEEPNVKIIWDEVLKHTGKTIMMDRTCLDTIKDIEKIKVEEFPKEFGLNEIPIDEFNNFDKERVATILKEKFNIDFSMRSSSIIDDRIELGGIGKPSFDEALSILLGIAKEKNYNIKKIYLIDENIADHVDGEFSHNDEKISEIISEQIEKEFGIKPEIAPFIFKSQVDESTLVVVDRHNKVANFADNMPKQISVLPLQTELYNNVKLLQSEELGSNFAKGLRKKFEVV